MRNATKIVIVGGVAGGASVAARARRLSEDAHIVIVERGSFVSYANCGLPFHISGEIPNREDLLIQTPEGLESRFNLDVRIQSEAVSIDRTQQEVTIRDLTTGETYQEPYDHLVLAPGSDPLVPPIPGIDRDGHFSLRMIPDMDQVIKWNNQIKPHHATVVGAGFIGMEMVEQLRRLEIEVSLVEARDQVMWALDPDMAAWAEHQLVEHDVDVRLNARVAAFAEPKSGETAAASVLVFEDGTRLPTDLVILSMGVRPEVVLATDAGLEVGKFGGIRVNHHMRTEDPHIWAVGDAIEVRNPITREWVSIPLAGPANRQGRVAADNIMGRPASYRGTWGTSIVRVFDLTLASTGLNENQLNNVGITYEAVHAHPLSHVGYYPGSEILDMKLLFSVEDGTIFGAQVIGKESAARRLDVLATAIQAGMTVDDVAQLELCYAPQFGAPKDPVNLLAMAARNIVKGDVHVAHWYEVDDLDADTVLIDVRTKAEYESGCIPGAISIPLDELRGRLDEVPKDKSIIVSCFSGQRSYFAYRMLWLNGFNVRNLTGGIRSWQATHSDAERHPPDHFHVSALAK